MARAVGPRRGTSPVERVRPEDVPPAVLAEFAKHQRAEANRRRRFGEVRPIVHLETKGQRFVFVGAELHWGDAAKLKWFPDILIQHMWSVLGSAWGAAEMEKPREDRHPIVRWKEDHYNFTQTLTPEGDGTYVAIPDSSTRAYILLAYDLYIVKDNAELQRRLVNRLRIVDQFQGARYELLATATFIRAGFDIAFERETDGSNQHNEFVATHQATGQQFVLEAKSRRRWGTYGFAGGNREPRNTMRVGVGQLLQDAILKPIPHPKVIFVDINFPPERMLPGEQLDLALWEMQEAVIAQEDENGIERWNMIVFTNTPYAWVPAGERFPREFAWRLLPNRPAIQVAHSSALDAIDGAIEQYGTIPMKFPER